jgi:hypothetical protein
MTRHRGRSRVYASALMPITVRGRVAVATRTRSRRSVSLVVVGQVAVGRTRLNIRRPFGVYKLGRAVDSGVVLLCTDLASRGVAHSGFAADERGQSPIWS